MGLVQSIAALFSRFARRNSGADPRHALGRRGERLAEKYLRKHGHKILFRNFRAKGGGEVDLVCRDIAEKTLVFAEVKTRTSNRFGTGFEAVTAKKQQRLRRLAMAWIAAEKGQDPTRPAWRELRFDVAVVNAEGAVEVLQAAF